MTGRQSKTEPDMRPEEALKHFRKLPKADLHVHFEGTVGAETLRELAARNDVSLNAPTTLGAYPPIPPPAERNVKGPFSGEFFEFIKLYVKISSTIRTRADFVLVAEKFGGECAAENVKGVEMYFTPTTFLGLGLGEDQITAGLLAAEEVLAKKFGIELRWIFDIVRNAPLPGEETVEIAKRLRADGVAVTAVGLAGLEAGYPAKPFATALGLAREAGFKIYAHAGETSGAPSVWETLELVAPDRIGHGVRAAEDHELLNEIRERNIPLEVCPWSNVALGVCAENKHPLPALLANEVPLVLASDDPGIFGRSLSENYLLAYNSGVSVETLEELAGKSLALFEPGGSL